MDEQSDYFTIDDLAAPAPQLNASQPSATQPEEYFTLDDMAESGVPAPAPVSLPEDIARTAGAQAVKGLADAPSMMSGALYYANKAIPKSPEVRASEVQNLPVEAQMDVEEGLAMPFAGSLSGLSGTIDPRISTVPAGTLPTMSGSQKSLEENLPFTQYEAQSKIADILGSGVRAAFGTAGMGSPAQAPVAAVAGSSGRGAGLLAEATSGSSGFGGATEIGTNVLVDMLSRKIGNVAYDLAAPNSAAFDKIAQGISVGLSQNPEKKALLMKAIQEGRDVQVKDLMDGLLDQKTKNWLEKNLPGDYAESIVQLHNGLQSRAGDITDFTNAKFAKLFGEDLTDSGWQKALAKAQAGETTALYDAVRANPAASNVFTPELQKMIGQGGVVQKAALEVSDAVRKGDLGDQIVPLAIKKGQNNKVVITSGTQPNFDYWDQVKKNLDAKAEEFYRAGNNFQGKIHSDAAKNVRDSVSNVVGEYPEARAAGQRAIQTPTSLEEGYNFGRTLTAAKPNLEKIDDFLDVYSKYNPEQKMRVQQGVGRALLQIGETGDFRQISRLMSTRGSRVALQEILGPEKFDQVYGTIAQNSLLKTTSEVATAINSSGLREKASRNPIFRDMVIAGGSGGGAAGIAAYTQSATSMMVGAGALALTSAAFLVKAGLDAKERKVASEVMRLALSQDTKDAANLGKLLSSNAAAVTSLRKITNTAQEAVRSGLLAYAREKERSTKREKQMESEKTFVTPEVIPGFNDGQADGGRVERKSGGRVGANSISAEVDRTRVLLSNKTASMLSMPDDAIVTALSLAKKK